MYLLSSKQCAWDKIKVEIRSWAYRNFKCIVYLENNDNTVWETPEGST